MGSPNDEQILVVDDDIVYRNYIQETLEKRCMVETTNDGVMALGKLKKATPSETPDLIILDIEMHQMTGFEFKKHLDEVPHRKKIPVIYLSAHLRFC